MTITIHRAARTARRRWIPVGTLTVPGTGGENATPFSGRIGGRRLRPGLHRAWLAATDERGRRSKRRTVKFRIVR